MKRGKRPNWMLNIAKERMDILFSLAEKEFIEYPERSHRYVELARKISTKYNVKFLLNGTDDIVKIVISSYFRSQFYHPAN